MIHLLGLLGGEVAGVEDDVVAFAVAEGAGDAESEAGGFEGEGEFGDFSAALGGEFTLERGERGRLASGEILLGRLCQDWIASNGLLSGGLLTDSPLLDELWARR